MKIPLKPIKTLKKSEAWPLCATLRVGWTIGQDIGPAPMCWVSQVPTRCQTSLTRMKPMNASFFLEEMP